MTKSMNAENRIADERALIIRLVGLLHDRGYSVGYHDGEELVVKPGVKNATAIVAELHSTDEARLVIRRPDDISFRAGVYLVYGNAPWEVFCDWTDIPELSNWIEKLTDACIDEYDI